MKRSVISNADSRALACAMFGAPPLRAVYPEKPMRRGEAAGKSRSTADHQLNDER